jgi:hypothetical protein
MAFGVQVTVQIHTRKMKILLLLPAVPAPEMRTVDITIIFSSQKGLLCRQGETKLQPADLTRTCWSAVGCTTTMADQLKPWHFPGGFRGQYLVISQSSTFA